MEASDLADGWLKMIDTTNASWCFGRFTTVYGAVGSIKHIPQKFPKQKNKESQTWRLQVPPSFQPAFLDHVKIDAPQQMVIFGRPACQMFVLFWKDESCQFGPSELVQLVA